VIVPLLQTAALPVEARPAFGAVALGYLAVVAAIAAWSARRTRTAGDFFVAGRGIGLWALALSAMAATLSGFAFIGGPGLVYTLGTGAVFVVLPAGLTGTLVAWGLAKRLRLLGEARGLLTIPDAIGARYDSRLAQGLAALAILVAAVGYTATNVLALGLVVDAVSGVGRDAGIWLGVAVTLAYSVSGGILAGVYADVAQGIVMAVASALVFGLAIDAGGGVPAMSRAILAADAAWLGPWGKLPPLAALSFFLVFGVGTLGQPHVLHKYYMLRDPRQLRWYPLLMTGAMAVTLLLFVGVGFAMKALVAAGVEPPLARADDATPVFLLRHAPVALAALVFTGAAAAIMSTVNSILSVGAAAAAHDLPRALGRAPADLLRTGRAWTLALGVAAAVVAQASDTLVAFLGIFGFGLFAATLVPSLAIGLNWPRATRAGAVASIATGLVLTLACETLAFAGAFTLPRGVTVSGLALVASLAVFVGVSWADRCGAARALPPDVRAVLEA
jgi:Na+/proline symporter